MSAKSNAQRQADFRRHQKENRATEVRFNIADLPDDMRAELAEFVGLRGKHLAYAFWEAVAEAKAYREQVFAAAGFNRPAFSAPIEVEVEVTMKK